MTEPIRPAKVFVLRLWLEPGLGEGREGWRGSIRLLDAGTETDARMGISFEGLDGLVVALRSILQAGTPSTG
jgi:hypothetical protein